MWLVRYIEGLRKRLVKLYPLHQDSIVVEENGPEDFIYYPGDFLWRQYVPLLSLYFMFFLYVYFSARKVEAVKSKVLIFVWSRLNILRMS